MLKWFQGKMKAYASYMKAQARIQGSLVEHAFQAYVEVAADHGFGPFWGVYVPDAAGHRFRID